MGFLHGPVTITRYRVRGPRPLLFGDEHLDRLRRFCPHAFTDAAGVAVGWTAGDHYADSTFTELKNVYPDHLVWDLRVQTDKLPADRFKAYYVIELKGVAGDDPERLPSARQKREAREAAREQLELEAQDGRYRKWTLVPCAWDAARGEVWVGTASVSQLDRFERLFARTFGPADPDAPGVGPDPVTAATLALALDPAAKDAGLAEFVRGVTPPDGPAWCAGAEDVSFLGNEFLLWLWHYTDGESDTLALADGSLATLMFAGGVKLECPRGQTGSGTLNHAGPTRLPEARRAIQAGKLPRKAGLTLVRHDEQYGLHLQAETLALSAVKLPPAPADLAHPRDAAVHRLQACRDLCEAVDLLYARFLRARLADSWPDDLARIRRWLQRAERVVG